MLGIALFPSMLSWGQEHDNSGSTIEYEVGIGTTEVRPGRWHGSFSGWGPQFYAEMRSHIGRSWDADIQVMGGTARNKIDNYETYRFLGTLYFDYNYRRWRDIQPFAGVGLGFGIIADETLPVIFDEDGYIAFNQVLFSPRVGIELWNRVRFSVDCKWMLHGYSSVGFNIGFVFGKGRL